MNEMEKEYYDRFEIKLQDDLLRLCTSYQQLATPLRTAPPQTACLSVLGSPPASPTRREKVQSIPH